MANDNKVQEEAEQIIGLHGTLPRLVVFDLDYTLWPFYCECCYEDDTPYLYPHARGILHALKARGIDMAIASRSPTPEIARPFLERLGIRSMFVAEDIFSSWSHKTEHFQKIHKKTGIPFELMIFFDDEDRNIRAVSKMGVTSILVHRGVTLDSLRQGLSDFEQKSSSSRAKK
ncbi:Haloacid dehalogenase-like hydrolase (HAD) superfamily protein [Abeliophyllum distichum]|uniref:Haloacid dehalogenase-like hydrolase (HAD) superfamily protein n=1 Tax=Abeliophyllum distichum TaxID=126358 RepID=A0ABD1SGP8_9LAMI